MKPCKFDSLLRYPFLATAFVWIGLTESHGQLFSVAESAPTAPLPTDAWQFMRYGGTMPDLYTGTAAVQIPLYTFEDADYELPLSLSYHSNGYRPNDPHGILGLGWTLSVGGMITREIEGVPDDYYRESAGYAVTNDDEYYGFYYYNQIWSYEWIFERFKMNREEKGISYFDPFMFKRPIDKKRAYETAPDVFSFRFGDHSGKFILGFRNEVHFFATNHPAGEYKLKIGFIDNKLDNFIITTGDGYKYYFGDQKTREYSRLAQGAPSLPEYALGDLNDYSTAWPLLEIYTPTKNRVYFYYEAPPYGSRMYETNTPVVSDYGPQSVDSDKPYNCDYLVARYNHSTKRIFQYRLERIFTQEGSILFTYKDTPWKQYAQDGNQTGSNARRSEIYDNRGLLSEIVIENTDNDTVRLFNFDYWYNPNANKATQGVGNPIPFLRTVHLPDGSTFGFDYYKENWNAPYFGTTAIDYAGYYNSSAGNDSGRDYGLNNIPQTVNPEGALFGMLKKVTYPTGGFTIYEYEPHDYSQIIARSRDEMSEPFLIETGGKDIQGAGLRIKSITDCIQRPIPTRRNGVINDLDSYVSMIDTVARREYTYRINGRSSGNCLTYPRQIYADALRSHVTQSLGPGSMTPMTGTDLMVKSLQIPQSVDKTGIEYRSVTEKRMDGSCQELRFCSYDDLPDKMLRTDTLSHTGNTRIRGARFLQAPSLSSQRGKLLGRKYYAADGKLVQRQEYVFDRKELQTIPYMKPLVDKYYITHHYVEDYPLKKITTWDYFDTDSLCTIKEFFQYNEKKQPKVINTLTHSGETHQLWTKYLHERTDLPDSLSKQISLQNFTQLVDEQEERHAIGNATNAGRKQTKYEYDIRPNRSIRLSSILTTNYLYRKNVHDPDAEYDTEITYDKYDSKNRVLQTTDRNGVPTSYIWGSGSRYLLARITNVRYEDLPKPEYGDRALTEAYKRKLRTISGALVETYDYIPLKGLSCHVDASGVETRYEYYPNGKLKAIKDADGNTLKAYEYSFQ